ncbi:MAG: 16S rRNA (adenine(1518)-N(6)/adenine(1519)-N(6))-dimethyltransferase RsmA [Alphaproteobacteria bacterium]
MSRIIPKKKLGQHFLQDQDVVDRTVAAANLSSSDVVLEIGPGPGILTKTLLKSPIKKLYSLEIDPQFFSRLKPLESEYPDRFQLIMSDALQFPLSKLDEPKIKIIANLPYNIGTTLIIRWLGELNKITSMTLMVQKEVAERIAGAPSTKSYGSLSILCQIKCEVQKLFDVPPQAFNPPPQVMSSVLQLVPKDQTLSDEELTNLENLTQLVFQQRRKMIRVSLKQLNIENLESLLEKNGFNPMDRPEDLSIEQFVRLSRLFEKSVS